MSDELMALLSLCVSIPMAVRQWKRVMNGKTRKDKFIETAKKNGYVVVGKAVDIGHYTDRDAPAYRREHVIVKYEYNVNGTTYNKSISFIDHIHPDYPVTIQIYYAKNRPRKVITSVDWPAYTGKYNSGRRQHALLTSCGLWLVLTAIVINGLKLLLQM